jgi:hypothetical protein
MSNFLKAMTAGMAESPRIVPSLKMIIADIMKGVRRTRSAGRPGDAIDEEAILLKLASLERAKLFEFQRGRLEVAFDDAAFV